ncbi:AMP-binding protein [uncultured Draconibacterium sp.]|uniref:AMP-binding protein n=1 Tax=uncultured Draconibacterium sp. TaxID=1573823 RepID=UPI0025F764DE|nr:AMP-binding protein [uncultured Draconibacterium sp.]
MELFPANITLNGHQQSVEKLLQQTGETAWQQEFIDFLKQWYNKNDFIEVQTSGSTGTPKTISLKKQFVAASAMRTIRYFNLIESDRILHCLPHKFIAGKLMTVRALLGKLDLYLIDPASDFTNLSAAKPIKFGAMVINQVSKYLALPHRNIQQLLIGGSAITEDLKTRLQSISTQCYSSYAMTETATHIALQQLNGPDKTDNYQCLEDISVELDQRGCIKIFMPGLPGNSIQTNDLGKILAGNQFKILGRIDNVIISGGMKFIPEQLETKLENQLLLPFFVGSEPDDGLGEKIVLFVEHAKDELLEKAISATCKKYLSKYERPKRIIFLEKIPRTKNGKIQRKR